MTPLASLRGPMHLDVHRDEIVLLRGPNGSGKTSVLRALAGLPNALGLQAAASPAGLSPQDARDALVGLTVEGECRLRRRAVPPRLHALRRRPSAQLSSGEARRVALDAAQARPLLLLDEPSEGLDAEGRAELRALVRRHAQGGAVVVADHGGLFDDVATRAVELGAAQRAPLPPMPRGEGAPVVEADAARVRGLSLPALSLGPGFHALVGANGAGKSTLLLRLAGLLAPEGVRVAGRAPEPGRTVRMLLPRAADHLTRERVADECPPHPLVPDALRARHPLSLSGGEMQRVALAKTLAAPAPCYLLDEPEAHLDAAGRALLVESIAARVKEGACVLAATHDEALAALAQTEVRL
ncbi:MAG TPA: ATP-binding cassette domain-containing protein [Candidatus Thermoplasmatota archaeon]|nr:ATP-binding cassette domain-containing protein [Candidatus Thermoplasmatota archaeon]